MRQQGMTSPGNRSALLTPVWVLLVTVSTNALAEWEATPRKQGEIEYYVYKPDKYSVDHSYPLVLVLHGAGWRGAGVEVAKKFVPCLRLIEKQEQYPCIIIAPYCTKEQQWVDVPWGRGSYSIGKVPESDELKCVRDAIQDTMTRFRIDNDRLYVVGGSMGGYGSWDLLCRHPGMWAAAVPTAGGGDPTRADRLINIPIWAFHGKNDKIVPVRGSREMIQAISDSDGDPLYTEYSSKGHLWTQPWDWESDSLLKWMFSKRRVVNDATPPTSPVNLKAEKVTDSRIELSWSPASDDDTSVLRYKVYRDGKYQGRTDSTRFTDQGLAESTNYKYQVSALNMTRSESARSDAIRIATSIDITAPTLVTATARDDSTVILMFSEPVDPKSAVTADNYSVEGIRVLKANVVTPESVRLKVSPMNDEQDYLVRVLNVLDQAKKPNQIKPHAQQSYTYRFRIEGLRALVNRADSRLALTAEGTGNRANVGVSANENRLSQVWRLASEKDGTYRFSPQNSNTKALELYSGQSAKLYSWNARPWQRWTLEKNADGFFTIRSNHLDGYLGVKDGDVILAQKALDHAQQWKLNAKEESTDDAPKVSP